MLIDTKSFSFLEMDLSIKIFESLNLKYEKNYKTKKIHQGNKTIHQGKTPICIIRYDMLK